MLLPAYGRPSSSSSSSIFIRLSISRKFNCDFQMCLKISYEMIILLVRFTKEKNLKLFSFLKIETEQSSHGSISVPYQSLLGARKGLWRRTERKKLPSLSSSFPNSSATPLRCFSQRRFIEAKSSYVRINERVHHHHHHHHKNNKNDDNNNNNINDDDNNDQRQ